MINAADMNDLQLEDVEDYSADYPPEGFPQADENIHTAGSLESPTDKNFRRSRIMSRLRANKWIVALGFLIFVVLIAIISIASGGSKSQVPSSTGSGVNQDPVKVDPKSVNKDVAKDLQKTLKAIYSRHNLDASVLDDYPLDDTPQRKAFNWMSTHAKKDVSKMDHTELVQRYALAVFYYSTNKVKSDYVPMAVPWKSSHLWLSTAHSCSWTGVVCNTNQHVTAINLEDNSLTGKLPVELALLGITLDTLDLTSNMIFMTDDDFDAFSQLTNLKTLLMDDNYLKYHLGLPNQMGQLSNLEKLRLSYNLFSGQLEDEYRVLKHMEKLTHLEIESNFFKGTMPPVIGTMSNLVYLYLRRNEMEFNLNFMKTGQLSNLFALWLDNNKITGTIPTEIGSLTELASVSITNSTLTGPIPTEFGKLKDLRRLWLYSNQLTGAIPAEFDSLTKLEVFEVHDNKLNGAMPQGICSAVGKSEYDYKSLTSDCQDSTVTCDPTCCTKCY